MDVLVIEDQTVAAKLMLAALRSLGHEPEHVTDGAEALARMGQKPFRVVVSDWRMPGVDGLEVCRKIRQQGADYTYFILVSVSGVTRENREEALAAGVDDFLAKPVDPDELRMRLHVAQRILQFTAQVKKLESFLPICGYCHKIRDNQNYWAEVEEYYAKRDGTQFSHGVCPACYERVVVPQLEKLEADARPPTAGGAKPADVDRR